VEAREAIEHPTINGTIARAKNYPAQMSKSSTEAESPSCRITWEPFGEQSLDL
jgi:hypothetical protein